MATHDYVIDNSTGANVRADLNLVLQAILSNNSSSTAPSTTAAYMWWADTNTGILKIRNSADNAWVELLQLDGTLTLEDGSASSPGLAFRDDLNTGVFSSAENTFNVATAGVERMELGATTIFNEDGADVDFRIESGSISSMFFVDAGNNRVGISDGSPSCTFEVGGTTSQTAIFQSNQSATTVSILDTDGDGINISGGTSFGHRILTSTTEALGFGVNNAVKMTLDSSGRLLINKSTNRNQYYGSALTGNLQVEGTDNDTRLTQFIHNQAAQNQHILVIGKSRGSSVGSYTVVQDDDYLGTLSFQGADGDAMIEGARIDAQVDGTPGNNDMPARLTFLTTADGASSTTERMRIDRDGNLTLGGFAAPTDIGPAIKPVFFIDSIQNNISAESGAFFFTQNAYFNSGGSYEYEIAAAASQYKQVSGQHIFLYAASGSAGANFSFSESLRINNSGKMGIGESSPATLLHLKGTDTAYGGVGNSTTASGAKIRVQDTAGRIIEVVSPGSAAEAGIGSITNHNFTIFTSNTERCRADSGNTSDPGFKIGTTAASVNSSNFGTKIQYDGAFGNFRDVNGSNTVFRSGGNAGLLNIFGDGDATNTNNSYGQASDETLKQDIVDAASQWEDIKALRVRKFRFKDNPTGVLQIGVVAQEIETVSAGLVKENSDGIKSVKYSVLYMKAVKCLQEAITKIETLETKVAALEAA